MAQDSTNKENISVQQLFADVKSYIQTEKSYLQLTAVEKLTKLIAKLIVAIVSLVIVLFILFYLSFALVYLLEPKMGFIFSYGLVAFIFLSILIVIIKFRKKLIITPVLKMIIDIFYDKSVDRKEDNNKQDTP